MGVCCGRWFKYFLYCSLAEVLLTIILHDCLIQTWTGMRDSRDSMDKTCDPCKNRYVSPIVFHFTLRAHSFQKYLFDMQEKGRLLYKLRFWSVTASFETTFKCSDHHMQEWRSQPWFPLNHRFREVPWRVAEFWSCYTFRRIHVPSLRHPLESVAECRSICSTAVFSRLNM